MNTNDLSIHYLDREKYSEEYRIAVIERMTNNEYNTTSIPVNNTIPSLEDYAYVGFQTITEFDIGQIRNIGIGAFENCTKLNKVTGTYLVDLKEFAFSQCSNLSVFEPICKTIPNNCFCDCYNLKSISVSESLSEIQNDAFRNCTELKTISDLPNVVSIGIRAFNGCYSLHHINLGDRLEIIDAFAFSQCGLTSITIPESVKYIETEAFSNNLSLKTVIFKTALNQEIYFNTDVFKNCHNVQFINSNNNPYIAEYLTI